MISGSIVALVTPMFDDGAVDWESLQGFLMRTDEMFSVEGLRFLDLDPRVVVPEVKEATAAFMGVLLLA